MSQMSPEHFEIFFAQISSQMLGLGRHMNPSAPALPDIQAGLVSVALNSHELSDYASMGWFSIIYCA